ncbi:unnamed protein product [Tuber aestivum]|uniref:Helitron helicase-like domain-containing protein n=1 Tax=Tuber aestivum TaxID=59557 RepID=A0A292Q2J4_9PEZI|nr:unnamed protein product [Tuber aestivum]
MDTVACNFRGRIREYNSAFAFTSLYHLQGPLQPQPNNTPAFAQLYFYDPTYAAHARYTAHPRLDSDVLHRLTTMLQNVNPYIAIYKTARERLEAVSQSESDVRVVLNPQLRLIMETGADR